jgi:plastocyanin
MNTSSAALPRAAVILISGILAVGLAACAPSGDATPSHPAGHEGATVTVSGGAVEISADDLAFNASVIEAPAGEAFTVTLVNNETQPHNFAVHTEEGGDVIVQGEIITGPDQSTPVEVPALEAGEYFFVCDVHATEMKGTVVVSG